MRVGNPAVQLGECKESMQTYYSEGIRNKESWHLKRRDEKLNILFEERREPRHSNIRKQGIQTLSLKRTGKPDILKKIERNPEIFFSDDSWESSHSTVLRESRKFTRHSI